MLSIAVSRDDLGDQYGAIVNQAVRDTQAERNWNCMRQKAVISIPSGDKSASFPDDFKCLTLQRDPIVQILPGGMPLKVNMFTREQIERLTTDFGELVSATIGRQRKYSVYTDVDDGVWFLGLLVPATEDLDFQVSYYRFLPKLDDDNDQNQLTRDYPQMIVNRAKSIAFQLVNDPMADAFEAKYQQELKSYSATDAYLAVAGRQIRM